MTTRSKASVRGRPALLLLALALAGCAGTGGLVPHTRPAEPDALQAAATLGDFSPAALPQRDWWKAFGDPQLDALVAEALAASPSLDAADARVRQAIAQAGLADAARQPTLSAGAQVSGIRLPETVVDTPLGGDFKATRLATLSFRYSPDLWGGQRARWEAALGQARAAEVEAEAARLTLAGNIVRGYVALSQAFEALDVARAEQARATRLAELARQRTRAGLDNRLPLQQAEVLVANASQQADAARGQIERARNALAALAGRGPDRGAQLMRPRIATASAPGIPSAVPSTLLAGRPDVVAARWRVEAAAGGIDAAKADFYPTVNLSALVGLAAPRLADLLSADALLAQGGPALSLPILDGGRLRNSLARSNADFDLAVAAYNGALVTGLREIADALQAARTLDARIAAATQARDAARRALELATARHRAGLATQLDVLAAQAPLNQVDQQLAALRAERLLAVADLDVALGGGLELAAPATSRTDSVATTP